MWLRDPEKARVESNPRAGSLIYSTGPAHHKALGLLLAILFSGWGGGVADGVGTGGGAGAARGAAGMRRRARWLVTLRKSFLAFLAVISMGGGGAAAARLQVIIICPVREEIT